MVYIPEGEFIMGCEAEYSFKKERPEHTIYLSPYWISKHEVTFNQFDQYCEEAGIPKPADEDWGRSDQPVINVSWLDAAKYCEWLSNKTGLIFRLATEAEWEKAAKGIDKRKYPWGDNDPDEETANFEYSMRKTSPVGQFPKGVSPYGVMDMSGNVGEWCYDWYDESFYKVSPSQNPTGPEIGTSRVIRGGGWGYDSSFLRTTNRNRWKPEEFNNDIGFRVVLSHYTPSTKIKDGLTIERF
jgi:formylglycine-generating enzyme required for sulfatase activity